MTDLIIVGGGPAGMTAAVYAVRAGLSVRIFEAVACGGQISSTALVENFPSVTEIAGWKLAREMQEQVKNNSVEIISNAVVRIEQRGDYFKIGTDKHTYQAKAAIIANGVKRKTIGCKGESEFIGKGVSWCAVCDGNFFKGKTVAVVGGGNSAAEDALYLAEICKKVYLIHRKPNLSAMKSLSDAVKRNNKIELLSPFTVEEIKGESSVNEITVKNTENSSKAELKVSAVFEAIGLIPDNNIFRNIVKLNSGGYIIASKNCRTATPGIFVAGDTREKSLRQIVTAASDGAIAATEAFKYLKS